jgi:transcriptional regulator with XRE-family HTH domain
MDVRKVVARNLRRLRVTRQLSQESLAFDAEIDRTHIGRIERGLEKPDDPGCRSARAGLARRHSRPICADPGRGAGA